MARTSKNASKQNKKSSTEVVSFETMESRQMFSVVTVTGTENADVISITQNGANFTVVKNGQSQTYANQPITKFTVDCLGGNDTVNVVNVLNTAVNVNAGTGNDWVNDGNGSDVINCGTGNDTVRANGGHDTVYGLDGNDFIWGGNDNDMIFAGRGNDVADGEAGNDYVNGNGQTDNSPTFTATTATTSTTRTARAVTTGMIISYAFWTDNDTVRGGEGNDVVDGAEADDVVYGGLGDDECWGGDGNDRIYGGGGNNRLIGGAGDDTLVAIGGGNADLLWGQTGIDSFWMDDARATEKNMDGDAAEYAGSNFHFVAGFQTLTVVNGSNTTRDHRAESKELNGGNFVDPIAADAYRNFSGNPLFAPDGASLNDVDQGNTSDCYFLAGLSAIARSNPNTIKQAVVDLGDGTYAVRFFQNGLVKYFRVDGDLPANSSGTLTNAGLGHGNSIWVAIMEKAFAYFRSNVGTYASLDFGYLYEPFNALALGNNSFFGNNATNLLQNIQTYLSQGKGVTISTPAGTPANGTPLVARHAYTVSSVNLGAGTITLRNPWATDGAGNDGNNDGYVTMTAAQFFGFCNGARWSNVA